MSAREFNEWVVHDRESPIGPERADLRSAIVAAQIVNVKLKRGAKPISPEVFLAVPREPAPAAKSDDLNAQIMGALSNRMAGGKQAGK